MSHMRRIAVIAVALAVAAPAAATPRVARIWLASSSPVVVAGRGFQDQERVKVTVAAANGRWAKSVLATQAGSLTARFRVSIATRCGSSATITALGTKGSRASWKLVDEQQCPPPLDPGK
jgi:hypothetical protein